jgi:hypothetical protein
MAFKPKQILDTALGLGKAAVSEVERRLRGRGSETAPTSGAPTTVGAAEPGKPGAPKSGTAPAAEPAETAAESDKTSTPRKRATGRRSTASRAAASSGEEVADAASGKNE